MNTKILNILKTPILSFINTATEEDCKLMMLNNYSTGMWQYIQKFKTGELKLGMLENYPIQSTSFPAMSFILGNDDSSLNSQTMGFETSELSDAQYLAYTQLAKRFNPECRLIQTKTWIHQSQVLIGVHTTNKIEATWLCCVLDYAIKFMRDVFVLNRILDVSPSYTDLRVNQELFKIQTSTRICQFSFKYEKIVPVDDSLRHQMADLDLSLALEADGNLL